MSVHEGTKENVSNLVFEIDAANIKSNSPNRFFAYGNSGPGPSADNDVSFLINGSGIFKRLGYGQLFGDYTITPSDVVYQYNLGLSGCHYHGNTIYVPLGAYVAFKYDYYISVDAKDYGVGENNTFLSNAENGGAGIGTQSYALNLNKGVWQTISGTFGPATASGNINFYLYPGACTGNDKVARIASSGYILYKNPQVEVVYSGAATVNSNFSYNHVSSALKDTTDSGVNATMYGTAPYEIDVSPCFNFATNTGPNAFNSSMGFLINTNPVPRSGSFTISSWIKNPNNVGQSGLFSAGGSDGFRFGVNPSHAYYLIGGATGTYKENSINFLSSLSPTAWYNVVVVYDRDTPLISLYLNGVFQGSDPIPSPQTTMSVWSAGIVRNTCCSIFTGKLSNLSVYNTALSAQDILSNFQANRSRYAV